MGTMKLGKLQEVDIRLMKCLWKEESLLMCGSLSQTIGMISLSEPVMLIPIMIS